jgi:hypothetical protein
MAKRKVRKPTLFGQYRMYQMFQCRKGQYYPTDKGKFADVQIYLNPPRTMFSVVVVTGNRDSDLRMKVEKCKVKNVKKHPRKSVKNVQKRAETLVRQYERKGYVCIESMLDDKETYFQGRLFGVAI